jgi:hypothetical protein
VVVVIVVLVFTQPSEEEKAAAVRQEFGEALKNRDFEGMAEAANEFSRLRGRTLTPVQVFEEIFPIGSTEAYPLKSLEISGNFVRRRLFYRDVASAVAPENAGNAEKTLAAFDWIVRNVWPPHTWTRPSGQNPDQIAFSGRGSDQEIGWVFSTILENLGINSMLISMKFRNQEEAWSLSAVNPEEDDGKWYLFAPDSGLPLVRDNGLSVATLGDFLAGNAAVPGLDSPELSNIEGAQFLLASEAQCFLHAASDLEKLLRENSLKLRCHRTLADLSQYSDSLYASASGSKGKIENASFLLWPYPFHIEDSAVTWGNTEQPDSAYGTYQKAKILCLTGKHADAVRLLSDSPVAGSTLTLAMAQLYSRDHKAALVTLKGYKGEGEDSDLASFIAGKAHLALGQTSEAAAAFKHISGPRVQLGKFLSERTLAGEETEFRLGGE